jgi:hypothetical protein
MYVSEAQRRKFHSLLAEGKISKATVDEFDKASKGMKLPEHVGDRKKKKVGGLHYGRAGGTHYGR